MYKHYQISKPTKQSKKTGIKSEDYYLIGQRDQCKFVHKDSLKSFHKPTGFLLSEAERLVSVLNHSFGDDEIPCDIGIQSAMINANIS